MTTINENGIDREATPQELAYLKEYKSTVKQMAETIAEQEAAAASGRAKLAALGLTDDEIAALVGQRG